MKESNGKRWSNDDEIISSVVKDVYIDMVETVSGIKDSYEEIRGEVKVEAKLPMI